MSSRRALPGLLLLVVAAGVLSLLFHQDSASRASEARPGDEQLATVADEFLAVPEPGAPPRSIEPAAPVDEPEDLPDASEVDPKPGDVARVLVLSALDQSPIAGAEVVAFLWSGVPRPRTLTRGTTDGDGTVELALGRLDLSRAARFATRLQLQGTAPGYLPSSSGLRLDQALSQTLELEPGLALRGRVLHAGGTPAEGAFVSLLARHPTQDDRSYHDSVLTDERGAFTLGVGDRRPASISASLEGQSSGARSLEGWDVRARPDLGDLVLRTGRAISGRVDCSEAGPLPGVTVQAKAVGRPESAGGGVVFVVGDGSARTGADGSFAIEGLTEDEYDVSLEGHPEEAVRARAGDSGLRLRSPGRALRVLVRDESGQGLPGIWVSGTLGRLHSGGVDAQHWVSRSTWGPEGGATFLLPPGLLPETALLRVDLWDGRALERSFELSGVCVGTFEIEVPDRLPTGRLRLASEGVPVGEPCRLELDSPLDAEELYRLDATMGEEIEVLEGSYRAVLRFGERDSTCFLPLELFVDVRRDRTTVIDRAPAIGGRLSVEARGAGGKGTCHVLLDEDHALFFPDEQGSSSIYLPLGRARIAREVLPPGRLSLRIDGPGERTTNRTVAIVAGETTALVVELGPE